MQDLQEKTLEGRRWGQDWRCGEGLTSKCGWRWTLWGHEKLCISVPEVGTCLYAFVKRGRMDTFYSAGSVFKKNVKNFYGKDAPFPERSKDRGRMGGQVRDN